MDESLENSGDDDVVFKQNQDSPIESTVPFSRLASPGVPNLPREGGTSSNLPFCHLGLASGSMPNVVEGSIISGSDDAPLQPTMDLFSVG